MKFAADVFQTQTPKFMDLGFYTIKAFDEISGLSKPATRIRRFRDGSHWITQDHVFGEATAAGISVVKSDHDYNYKTDFQIWK